MFLKISSTIIQCLGFMALIYMLADAGTQSSVITLNNGIISVRR
jgi:hypothetical protein